MVKLPGEEDGEPSEDDENEDNEEEDNDQYGSELLDSVPVGGDDDFDDDAGGSFD